MARPTKYSKELCDKVDAAFDNGNSVCAACLELDIDFDTYHKYKKDHPEFAAAAFKGESKSQRFWEEMGVKGASGQIEKFGGPTWQFIMKNRFRRDYGDQPAQKTLADTLVEKLVDKLIEDKPSK